MTGAEQFLPYLARRPAAGGLTVFCLPYAGAGASVYRDWPAVFPPDVDVQPVQLPGREGLSRLPHAESLTGLADLLAPVLHAVVDRPFVLFGHSMGAYLAAEICARHERRPGPRPALLVVSGQDGRLPPDEPSTPPPDPGDDALVRQLVAGGADPGAYADPELRELLLAVLRADFRLCERYRPTCAGLSTPVLALSGTDDPGTPPEALTAWRSRTDGRCRVVRLPGRHGYLHQHVPVIAALVREEFLISRRTGVLRRPTRHW